MAGCRSAEQQAVAYGSLVIRLDGEMCNFQLHMEDGCADARLGQAGEN